MVRSAMASLRSMTAGGNRCSSLRAPEPQLLGIISALSLDSFLAIAAISVVADYESAAQMTPVLRLRLFIWKIRALRVHPCLFECHDLLQSDWVVDYDDGLRRIQEPTGVDDCELFVDRHMMLLTGALTGSPTYIFSPKTGFGAFLGKIFSGGGSILLERMLGSTVKRG